MITDCLHMSFLQRFMLSNQQKNMHMNHIACVESDYSGKPCEQLFQILGTTQDPDVIKGLKKILLARGYTRKEIQQVIEPQTH